MTDDGEAGVELTHQRVMCELHGEPFRARWPKGYPIFAITLMKIIIDQPRATGEEPRSPNTIGAELDAQPACCRVTPAELERAYEQSGVGVLRRCRCCRLKRLGTPFKTAIAGRVVDHRHICFRCVIHNTRPLN